MEKMKIWIKEYKIILLFALAKLVVHLLTATNYGFQRDAYLYLAQSNHLAWGFFSTPPLVAFITRIHTIIWGDSLLAVRVLPALIGTTSLFLAGWLIKQLKGGVMAQVIGLTAIFLSPAFLRPAVLLQPVVFNHLFWLLTAVVVFRLIQKQEPRQLLWFIPVLGLGWLAKYSIVFYASAMLAALMIGPHRKLLWSKYLPWTLAGGLILIVGGAVVVDIRIVGVGNPVAVDVVVFTVSDAVSVEIGILIVGYPVAVDIGVLRVGNSVAVDVVVVDVDDPVAVDIVIVDIGDTVAVDITVLIVDDSVTVDVVVVDVVDVIAVNVVIVDIVDVVAVDIGIVDVVLAVVVDIEVGHVRNSVIIDIGQRRLIRKVVVTSGWANKTPRNAERQNNHTYGRNQQFNDGIHTTLLLVKGHYSSFLLLKLKILMK